MSKNFRAILLMALSVGMREPSQASRWLSIIIGFIGMMVILRPGFADICIGTGLVLSGTIFVATSKLMTKSLSCAQRSD